MYVSYVWRWFKKKRKPRSPYPKIVRIWRGRHCNLLQLQRGIRGEVITLRIVSFSSWDYLFTCDKLQELQAELVGTFDGEDIFLKESTCRLQTHRFGVFIINNFGTRTIGIWDVNLEVPRKSKKSASRAVAAVAFHAMRIKASSQASWDAQFLTINWMQLLQEKAQNELGQFHNLNGEAIIERRADGTY